MSDFDLSRRRFLGLTGLGALGALGVGGLGLAGCASSAGGSGAKGGTTKVTLQSNLSSPQAKTAMEKRSSPPSTSAATAGRQLNTVASETFRTQLPTYLTSANPPDVYTWYAGSVAETYASKDLLLDVSDVWGSRPPATPAR